MGEWIKRTHTGGFKGEDGANGAVFRKTVK